VNFKGNTMSGSEQGPVFTRSRDRFLVSIRLESMLPISAMFEIGPNHVSLRLRLHLSKGFIYLFIICKRHDHT
jgi:hypothetical protein